MRFFSFGFRGKNRRYVAGAVAAVCLAGCSEDPGLQERLNRLQAEMQEKDRQLQDARSALEKTKSELKAARASSASKPVVADPPAATPDARPQFLSRQQVEESYDSASKAMQKRLASELRNYSVENCTQFPVSMPSDEYPYYSKVALTFRSDNGRSYRLEFPVSADTSGKWTFPNSMDIKRALADSRLQDPSTTTAANNPTPAPTSSPKVTQSNATSDGQPSPHAEQFATRPWTDRDRDACDRLGRGTFHEQQSPDPGTVNDWQRHACTTTNAAKKQRTRANHAVGQGR